MIYFKIAYKHKHRYIQHNNTTINNGRTNIYSNHL